ncbi:hypothetical protein ACOMHN_042551 [Nucella lapillus]
MATVRILDEEDQGKKKFSAERAMMVIQNCVSENGDVSLPGLIEYAEEFLKLSNTMQVESLNFALGAASEKVSRLRELCEGEGMEHYSTVQSTVAYETQQQLVDRQDRPSGTVTLIRLHRLMEFFCAALDKINDRLTSGISRRVTQEEFVEVYRETWGRFHPQLMVACIQSALPQFFFSLTDLMAGMGLQHAEGDQWLLDMGHYLRRTYDAIHKVYHDHGLLGLPQGSL